jgi:hypothetical protein
MAQFFTAAGLATLIMRFGFYWLLRGWLISGDAPCGLPEVSLLWVVSILAGLAITCLFFTIIHRVVNRIIRRLGPIEDESPVAPA